MLSQVLVVSRNVNNYGVSALAVRFYKNDRKTNIFLKFYILFDWKTASLHLLSIMFRY